MKSPILWSFIGLLMGVSGFMAENPHMATGAVVCVATSVILSKIEDKS